nr:DUF2796 domain-containing protein [Roseateles oligotrophus]
MPAWAHVHQHGVARLDVALEGQTLTLQLNIPMDSLLGYERRPRTVAEREAAAAVLAGLDPGSALWQPNPEAQCGLVKTTLVAPLLQSPAQPGVKDAEHADLDGSWEFRCAQADQLSSIELGLFDAFKRLQRLQVQVAGPKGQIKRELKRPNKLLNLTR